MPAAQGGQLRVRKVPGAGPAAPVAIGETVILMTPLFIRIETPAKGRGGCSRMTASPTARLLASLAKLQKNGSKRHARSAARPLRWLAFVSVDLCRAHGGAWVFSVTLVIFTNGPKACARTPQSDATVGAWPFLFLMTPLFIRIETPSKGRGGCSRMTASPTAWTRDLPQPVRETEEHPSARCHRTMLLQP